MIPSTPQSANCRIWREEFTVQVMISRPQRCASSTNGAVTMSWRGRNTSIGNCRHIAHRLVAVADKS